MNINDKVSVKLTPKGLEVLIGYLNPLGVEYTPRQDCWYIDQLWCLMAIFGPFMRAGAPILFEDNKIYLEGDR